MSYSGLTDNQTVSFNKLSNAVSTGVFRQKTTIPSSAEMITKSDASTYVHINTGFSSYSNKSSGQLVVKKNLQPDFENSATMYYTSIPDALTGWSSDANACSNYSAGSTTTVYWNGTLVVGTLLFSTASKRHTTGDRFFTLNVSGTFYTATFNGNTEFIDNGSTGLWGATVASLTSCVTYTEGVYDVGSAQTICSSPTTVTTYRSANSSFTTGTILYTNTALTTPLTGYSRIIGENNNIWNLNSSTGAIGSDTGNGC